MVGFIDMEKKQILYGVVALVVLLGGNVAATFLITDYLLNKKAEEAAVAAAAVDESGEKIDVRPPIYIELEPFVVNYIQGQALRYLQMNVQIMSRDQAVVDEVTINTPQIRNALILLLSSQSYEELATREGKESIRTMIHEEVNKLLAGDDGVESVFLTGFVMQ